MDPLYKSGGHCYIFPIYGIGYCFNVVTESENVPRAVLIRALEPVDGMDLMLKRRNLSRINSSNLKNLTNGPVKLCEAMDIDAKINGNNLCGDELFILGQKLGANEKILTSTRINIDYAEEDQFKPWRFILEGNKFLSRTISFS